MKVKPCGYRLVVKQDHIDEKDDTYKRAAALGLQIAGTEKDREQMGIDTGIVLEIGPECWEGKDPWCQIGDRVVFAKYAGKVVGKDENKVIILNDEDVVGVIND